MAEEEVCVTCNGAVVPVKLNHESPYQVKYDVSESLASSAYDTLRKDGAHVEVHGADNVWSLKGATVRTYRVGNGRRFEFTAREERYRTNAAQHLGLVAVRLNDVVDVAEDHENPFKPETNERVVYEE
ncbi:MAG TPA: hypothetical protein VJG30_03780 [Candidatus Nanoarchaeia archaeon]|nr:hypothetical protein [Candidatus Nanoarchaeia archaeon]